MRALIVLLMAAVASARLAPLFTHNERIPGRYIVKLKAGVNVDATLASLGLGVSVRHKFNKLFPGFAAQLSGPVVDRLRKLDVVEYIEEDSIVRTNDVASWGLDRIDQLSLPLDDVYEPIGDGNGVDVYVIDTGINLGHVDYGDRSRYGYDARDDDFEAEDCNGHGTHCAGTVGGTEYGVAKASRLFGVRVLGCLGSGSTADVVAGCEWVAANATLPAVASMSLGGGASAITDDAVEAMINNGITVAVAAGNSDDDACDYSPARAPAAITVGATDISDVRASFSNYGTCLDIFAPGVLITSAWIGSDTATRTISGTSMACPHVAGAAAILLGSNSTLTPLEVGNALSLKSIADTVSDPVVGSPNLLLYIGEGNGGGYIPEPSDPIDELVCGGFFNASSGTFTSPNYPNDYDNDLVCDYVFSGVDGDAVTVAFNDFNVENEPQCGYDAVLVYDGKDTTSKLLGTYCGSEIPDYVASSGSNMLVRFLTDGSVTDTGFSAMYVIDKAPGGPETGGCGHTFTKAFGTMSSPNYPSNYGNHEDCSFLIEAPMGQTITVNFMDFELEDHTSCGYDALEIFDGADDMADRLANVCGDSGAIPEPVSSTSNRMFLRFTSDSSVTRRGFSAGYLVN